MKLKVTKSGVLKTFAAKFVKKEVPGSDQKQEVRVIDFSAEFDYTDGDLSYLLGVNSKTADDNGYDSAKWGAVIGHYTITINEAVIENIKIMGISRKNSDKGSKYSLQFRTENIESTTILPHYLNDNDSLATFMIEEYNEPEDKETEQV